MERLFVSDDGKLRSWLQLSLIYMGTMIAQLVAILPISVGLGVYLGIKGQSEILEHVVSNLWFNSTIMAVGNIVDICITIFLYKFITKKNKSSMGLTPFKDSTKQFVRGLLLGMVCITSMIIVLTLTGSYVFSGIYLTSDLLMGLILFIAVGFGEEILVRGAFQHIILQKHKAVWAIFIPSILFSAMHLGNPNVAPVAVVNLFLAGILLALMTYKTGNLWMAIGWHITWNFTMGNLFGVEVSGLELGKGLIQMERVKDTVLNGGNFGLEGGYLCTFLLGLVIAFFLWGYKKVGYNTIH